MAQAWPIPLDMTTYLIAVVLTKLIEREAEARSGALPAKPCGSGA
jgi:hypothetical protein